MIKEKKENFVEVKKCVSLLMKLKSMKVLRFGQIANAGRDGWWLNMATGCLRRRVCSAEMPQMRFSVLSMNYDWARAL